MSISGALLKYFGASSATGGQDEPPTSPARQDSAEDQDEEEQPSTSSAPTHSGMVLTLQDEPPSMSSAVSPQISDIEDEDLFASRPTSPQHEPSGWFLHISLFVCVRVCVCVFICGGVAPRLEDNWTMLGDI